MKASRIWVFLLALLFSVKTVFLFSGVSVSDEALYTYMAKRVSLGMLPYRDFFFAHPPFALLLQALFFKLFGFGLFRARLLPFVFGTLSVLFFLSFFKKSREKTVFLMLSFTLSFVVLSSYFMFYSTMLFFSVLGSQFFFKKKHVLSGSLFALATFCRFFGIAPFLACSLLALKRKRDFAKMVCGFLIVIIPAAIFFATLSPGFFYDILFYHFKKPAAGQGFFDQFLLSYLVSMFPFLLFGFPVLIHSFFRFFLLSEEQKFFFLWTLFGLVMIIFSKGSNALASFTLYSVSIVLPFSALLSVFSIKGLASTVFSALVSFWLISSFVSIYRQFGFEFKGKVIMEDWASLTRGSVFLGTPPSLALALYSEGDMAGGLFDLDHARFEIGDVSTKQVVQVIKEEGVGFVVLNENLGGIESFWSVIVKDAGCTLFDSKPYFPTGNLNLYSC